MEAYISLLYTIISYQVILDHPLSQSNAKIKLIAIWPLVFSCFWPVPYDITTFDSLCLAIVIIVFIQLSAQGAYLIFGLSGWALIRGGHLFEAGRLLKLIFTISSK